MIARLGDKKPTTMISHGSSYKLNPIEEGVGDDESGAVSENLTLSPRKPPSILETTDEQLLSNANVDVQHSEPTGSSDEDTPDAIESEHDTAEDVFLQEEP